MTLRPWMSWTIFVASMAIVAYFGSDDWFGRAFLWFFMVGGVVLWMRWYTAKHKPVQEKPK